jgi:AbrB family looped-hinge helix DNA binding protein
MVKIMTVGPKGQVVIPAEFRAALGIRPGDSVVIEKDDNGLRLTTRKALLTRLRGAFADVPRSLSDELLLERRDEAKRKGW